MQYNYTKTVLILIACQAGVRALVGSEGDKMLAVAILIFIFGTPIALFADWRSHQRERRLAEKAPRYQTGSESGTLLP